MTKKKQISIIHYLYLFPSILNVCFPPKQWKEFMGQECIT